MPELQFKIMNVVAMASAATPTLVLGLRIANMRSGEQIHSIALNVQLHIEPARRRYNDEERHGLTDLFGEPERWSSTVRPLYWTTLQAAVPSFEDETAFDLLVPCSYDFNVAATKYFHAIEDGEVPVALMFSGTVFYVAGGPLQAVPIPWSQEASCRVPVAIWKKMMALHYPNAAWLAIRRDVFDRIMRYKVRHGLPTWEQTLEHVLAAAGEGN